MYAATITMPPEIAEQVYVGVPAADWRVLAFLFAGAIVSTVSFGLVPALQATRVELVRAVPGEVSRDARPGRARQALIAVQVGASALLLISAAVFLRSAFAAALADPGLRTSDTITVPIANEPRRAAIVHELTVHPSVVAVAASSPAAQAQVSAGEVKQTNDSAETSRSLPVDYKLYRPIFPTARHRSHERTRFCGGGAHHGCGRDGRFRKHGAKALAKRSRRRTTRPHSSGSTEPRPPNAPLLPSRAYTVVGVARDVNGGAMFRVFSSPASLPTNPNPPGTPPNPQNNPPPSPLHPPSQSPPRPTASHPSPHPGPRLRAPPPGPLPSAPPPVLRLQPRPAKIRAADAQQPFPLPPAPEFANIVRVFDPMAYTVSVLVIVAACVLAAAVRALRAARVDPIATLND